MSWSTVTVCPAIDSDPVRGPPLFCATLNVTVPLPVPAAPDAIDSHGVDVVADQVQVALVATLMVGPAPPLPGAETLDGDTLYEQGAAWETLTVRPATVRVPFLAAPVLAATLNLTDPDPLPLAPDAMLIHGALLEADQVQLAPVVTLAI
jgi:hypothetical protein